MSEEVVTGPTYPFVLDDLPQGWRAAPVAAWFDEVASGFASGIHNQDGAGIPHLRPMNIDETGSIRVDTVKFVPPEAGDRRLAMGDVLFNNTNSAALVGKTAFYGRSELVAYSNHMTRLRGPRDCDPAFFAYQLHFLWMRGYFRARCVNHVNQASVASSTLARSVPLIGPSVPEQHRIVAAIEAHFSRLDAAVASLTRAKANVKRARASVLKAAVEGRLVPTEAELARSEGRDYEPASRLLERILAERRAAWAARGKRGKYKEPVAPDTRGLPGLPEGWIWTWLGQAFAVEVGATPSRNRPEYWGGDVPWVSSGEVQFCRVKSTRETITREGLQNTSTKVHPKGTVLLGMIGQGRTRGQAAILDIEACNNQNSAAIRVSDSGCVPEYVYGWLQLQYEQTRRLGSGNNQQALNKARVEAIPLPLPPIAEQYRIVAEVDRRLSVLDALDATIDANLARCARLRQSILKRAFEGRLVPPEPSDDEVPLSSAELQPTRFQVAAG